MIEQLVNQLLVFSKPYIEPFLSYYIYSSLLGVLIGAYITHKLTINRDRILMAHDSYRTLFGALFIKLSTIKTGIELKQMEFGKRNFKKVNYETKKNKSISVIAQMILEVSDDLQTMIKKYDQDKFSITVISRCFAIDQIKEQIRLAEAGGLGFGDKKRIRQSRISRLYYELACAKISFVQAILEDMLKISRFISIKDKETKDAIKFLLKICKGGKKKEISKIYGIEESKSGKMFGENDALAG